MSLSIGRNIQYLLFVLAGIVAGALGCVFFTNVVLKSTDFTPVKYPPVPITYIQDTVKAENGDTVPLLAKVQDARYDTLHIRICQLEAANAIMAHRQEVLVDDHRQETNNYINKINGWLSLWILIIGILCVLLPVIVQYMNYKTEHKKLIERIREQNRRLLDTEKHIRSLDDRIEKRERMHKGLSLIQTGIDNSIVECGTISQYSYLNTSWKAAYEYIKETTDEIFKVGRFSDDKIRILQEMILYMSDYKRQLMRIAPRYRRRRFEEFDDILSLLYRQLETRDFKDILDFKSRYNKAVEVFQGLLGISYM